MINLNQLRAFYYVAKYSSYTIAAGKLFISQPAVTAQVKLFEKYNEIKLFKKLGKKFILTHAGKVLYEKAEFIFNAEDELEQSLDLWQFAKSINNNFSRDEKIGVVETLWRIVYVDGKMDEHEHYLMNKLKTLLRLSHDELINAKLKVKQSL